MKIRPAEPDRDFAQLAIWFSSFEDEPTSEPKLHEYYTKNSERILHKVAESEHGELLGFYWTARDKHNAERRSIDLFVKPEQRGQGLGRQLYADLMQTLDLGTTKNLHNSVCDLDPNDRAFFERRGFVELRHLIGMEFDLGNFDFQRYHALIAGLESQGFKFTSMEALGDTEEAQRKLYQLNEVTEMDTLGGNGMPTWSSFENFQENVCHANWYKPAGQIVCIDTASGAWAALGAITRQDGNDYAYNLYTGVERAFRGQKLAQAIKALTLRYAKDILLANSVRTHLNAKNQPIIVIAQKMGYHQIAGRFAMEKALA